MKKHLLLFCFFLITALPISAQYFGGFSSDIFWREIETPHLRIVFSAGMESQAKRVANEIEFYISKEEEKQAVKLRKINLVINNQGVVSNGYVTSMPYHSMFFTQAPQDANLLGTQDWLTSLAVHEYRHVWQYNQMRSGWSKFLYGLWGDEGWGTFSYLVFPNWYFEGDAVLSETKYTNSGRGRLPHFTLTQRALALDSVRTKYKLVRNGSFKRELPSHYEFGYNLLAYGEKKYGEGFWPKVVKKASRLGGFTYSFSKAIKSYSGRSASALYDSMLVDYSAHVRSSSKLRKTTASELLTPSAQTVTNYYQSCFETDSTLLLLKDSYKGLLAFYRFNLHSKKEQKLLEVGFLENQCFSYANGTLIWTEQKHDVRRLNTEYSVIKKLNLKSGKQTALTKTGRYFSPALHPHKNELAVVSCDIYQHYALKIISSTNGLELLAPEQLRFVGGEQVSSPTYSDEGNSLIFILKKNSKLALFEYNFDTKLLLQLTDYSSHAITNPVAKASKVYFSASYQGQDDIFCVDRNSKQLSVLVSSRIGAYLPAVSIDGSHLVFSNYSLSGYYLQTLALNDSLLEPFVFEEPKDQNFYAANIYANDTLRLDSISQQDYAVASYRKSQHAINIHSWGPSVGSDDLNGLEINSNNVLNDLSIAAGVYYSNTEELGFTGVDVVYGGLFPELNFNYLTAQHPEFDLDILEAGIALPFDFSTPVYSKNLRLHAGLFNQTYDLFTELYAFKGMSASFAYSNYKLPARLQVAPRKGFSVDLSLKDGLLNDFDEVSEYVFNAELYLPGLAQTHAASLQYAGKTQNFDGFFQDGMTYARGFNRPDSDFMSYDKYSVNYQFPLCYPDAGINGFFFLKRIRVNLFADLAQARMFDLSKINYKGYGAEFYFDMNWFNLITLPIYVRYVRLHEPYAGQAFEFGANVVTF